MNEFEINPTIQKMNNEEWEAIEEESFKVLFKHSPIKRTKLKGLKRNITFIRTK
jgi:epoxyqueuosine reductase